MRRRTDRDCFGTRLVNASAARLPGPGGVRTRDGTVRPEACRRDGCPSIGVRRGQRVLLLHGLAGYLRAKQSDYMGPAHQRSTRRLGSGLAPPK